MSSVQRAYALLLLLLECRQGTAAQLARQLGVTPAMVYRDVETLSAAGIPVTTLPRKGGGIFLSSGLLEDPSFSAEDLRQVLSALAPAGSAPDPQLLSRLGTLLRRDEPWLDVELPRLGVAGDSAAFEALHGAIVQHRAVAFTYTGPYAPPLSLRVFPLRLLFRDGRWLLQAFSPGEEEFSLFPLSRLSSLTVTDQHFRRQFTPPPVPTAGEIPPLFRMECTLRFSAAAAPRAAEDFDPRTLTPLPDGGAEVRATLQDSAWLHSYLLSYGREVEVLAPARLRRSIAQTARDVSAHYADG